MQPKAPELHILVALKRHFSVPHLFGYQDRSDAYEGASDVSDQCIRGGFRGGLGRVPLDAEGALPLGRHPRWRNNFWAAAPPIGRSIEGAMRQLILKMHAAERVLCLFSVLFLKKRSAKY